MQEPSKRRGYLYGARVPGEKGERQVRRLVLLGGLNCSNGTESKEEAREEYLGCAGDGDETRS